MTQLTDPWAPTPAVICDFGWYQPGGTLFPTLSYSVNGTPYPPTDSTWSSNGQVYSTGYKTYTTLLGTPIVFDTTDAFSLGIPKVIVPTGVQVVSYQWDLGNGQTAIGPAVTVQYNYTVPPPDAAVRLTVTDSLGRRYSTQHLINLQALNLVYGTQTAQRPGTGRS